MSRRLSAKGVVPDSCSSVGGIVVLPSSPPSARNTVLAAEFSPPASARPSAGSWSAVIPLLLELMYVRGNNATGNMAPGPPKAPPGPDRCRRARAAGATEVRPRRRTLAQARRMISGAGGGQGRRRLCPAPAVEMIDGTAANAESYPHMSWPTPHGNTHPTQVFRPGGPGRAAAGPGSSTRSWRYSAAPPPEYRVCQRERLAWGPPQMQVRWASLNPGKLSSRGSSLGKALPDLAQLRLSRSTSRATRPMRGVLRYHAPQPERGGRVPPVSSCPNCPAAADVVPPSCWPVEFGVAGS